MNYLQSLGRALLGRASAVAVKASAFGPMIARMNVDRPAWPGVDFQKLAQEGYQQNWVVHHAVDQVAKAVASIPIIAYKGKGSKRTEVEEHPVLDLLAMPNLEQDQNDFIKAWVSSYLLTGNAFIERTDERKIERMELYVLRTDRTRVVPGADGLPAAYEYSVGGSVKRLDVNLDAGERPVLHHKTFNPLNDWYGLSPLQPCAWAIDITNEANVWNLGILRNSGAPSGAFVFAPKEGDPNLTEEQRDTLRRELQEHVQGASNTGRPLIMEGGFSWQQMGLNAEQMQYVDAANKAAREVCITLGVPPQMLGIPGDNTYSNYQEARQAFYQDTVIPLAKRLVARLSHWFAKQLGEGVTLDVNVDGLEALAAARKDMWQGLQACTFLSINEKREAVGYSAVDGGDDVYIGAGQLPLGTPSTIQGGADPTEPKPKAGAKSAGLPRYAYHQRSDLP